MAKRIMNEANTMVDQILEGFMFEQGGILAYDSDHRIVYDEQVDSRIPIISGGGSGHEPGHFGYVGDGMLTAAVHGEIFVPPTSEQVLAAIRIVDKGDGVLLIIKNFAADLASFLEAKAEARSEGRKVEHVIVNDDVSIENNRSFEKRRRGVAGTIFVHKILGAAAREGLSLAELKELGDSVITNLSTLGVALSQADLTGEALPHFELGDNEVYFGVGIHGEKGYRKEPLVSSEILAVELLNKLKSLYLWQAGESFAVLINGLGGTPLLEQYIFANDIRRLMDIEGIEAKFVKVGNQLTSLNMEGISLTLLHLTDLRWIKWLEAPVAAPKWKG